VTSGVSGLSSYTPAAGKLLKDPTRGVLSSRSNSWSRTSVEVAARRLGRAARDPQDVALASDHDLRKENGHISVTV
jgi:hypothetical protein